MSVTAKIDLEIKQGATFRRKFAWKDKKLRPLNLTGYTARMQIRETLDSPDPVITLTTENAGIVIDGAKGFTSIYISAADTALMTIEHGVYDLELIASNGDVYSPAEGLIYVKREVTK